jgi:general secretion pathway protein K
MNWPSSQRGVALIVALLVIALATVLIAGLLDRGELAYARTRNQLHEAQAQSYALGLEVYAERVLKEDQAKGNGVDTNDSPWATPLPPTPVPGGTIAAAMRDLNGRFNLNNLDPAYDTAQVWRQKAEQLLDALKLDRKLAGDIVAWMDPAPGAAAAGDAFYLAQPVPYRSAKRQFSHVSELRLIRGIDGDVYAKLAPYVSALPPGTRINVNTASVPVLMTLTRTTMTSEMAQAIWQHGHAHFQQTSDVGSAQPQLGPIDHPEYYDVHSSYFLASGLITLDGLPLGFNSIIERRQGGADGGIRVIQRSRGTD